MPDGPTVDAPKAPPASTEQAAPKIEVKGNDGGSIDDHKSALDRAPQFGGALKSQRESGSTDEDVIRGLGSEDPAGDTQPTPPMSGAERAGFGPVQQPRQLDQVQPGSGADRAGFGPDQVTPAAETPVVDTATAGATGNAEQKFNVAGANPDMAAAVANANGQDPEAARQRAEDENAQAQRLANGGAENTSATQPEDTAQGDAQADKDDTTTPDSDTTDNEKRRYFTGIRTKANSIRTRYLAGKAVRADRRAGKAEDRAEVKRAKADKAQEVAAGRTPAPETETTDQTPPTETQTPPSTPDTAGTTTPETATPTPDAEATTPEKPVDTGETQTDPEADADQELSPEAAERKKSMEMGAELAKLGIDASTPEGKKVFDMLAENPDQMDAVRATAEALGTLSKLGGPEAASAAATAAAENIDQQMSDAEKSGDKDKVARLGILRTILLALGKALLVVGALAVRTATTVATEEAGVVAKAVAKEAST
jgi:hypothetical protein